MQVQTGVWGNPTLLLQMLNSTAGNILEQADDTLPYFHNRWILFYKYNDFKKMLKCHMTEKPETLWLFRRSSTFWILSLPMHQPVWETFSVRGTKFNPLIWSAAVSILSSLAFQLELLLSQSDLRALMKSLKNFEYAHNLGQNTSRGSLLWFWTVQDKAYTMHSTCKFAHGFFGDEVVGILDRGGNKGFRNGLTL